MLSTHAQARSQQRAIPRPVIDLLLDYGVVEHRKNGLELLYFTNEGKYSARLLMKKNGGETFRPLPQCLFVRE